MVAGLKPCLSESQAKLQKHRRKIFFHHENFEIAATLVKRSATAETKIVFAEMFSPLSYVIRQKTSSVVISCANKISTGVFETIFAVSETALLSVTNPLALILRKGWKVFVGLA